MEKRSILLMIILAALIAALFGAYFGGYATIHGRASDSSVISFYVEASTDATPPNITLLNPSDGFSSSSPSMTFEFNATDVNVISNCSLIIDGVISATSNSITSGAISSFGGEFEEGAHTWGVNCTDNFGNNGHSSTRTFTITAEAPSEEERNIGGYAIYSISQQELEDGTSRWMSKKSRLSFVFEEQRYYAILEAVAQNEVTISVRPANPSEGYSTQTISLKFWEIGVVDITGDGVFGVRFKFEDYLETRALIEIRLYRVVEEEAPIATTPEERARKWAIVGAVAAFIAALWLAGYAYARILRKSGRVR